MDFNTGGDSGRPEDRPLYGEEAGGPTRGPAPGPAGSPGGEFNLQDPINSFVGTVRALVRDPVGFFRSIARRGDFVNPLIFAAICALISALLGGIISLALSPLFAGPGDTGGEVLAGGIAGFVANLILTPIFVVIVLFIGAAITHLLVMLLVRPQNAGFEATFRVGAYSQVTQLVGWIPIIGWLVAVVWAIVLSIFGIREVHSTSTGTAVLVVLIPVGVLLLLGILLGAALVALLIGSQQQF
ncbi:MAG: YIP1 family protein [Actinomycetota bacterium]|nr:YIP1 family protein [Actinomycetota bacterium]